MMTEEYSLTQTVAPTFEPITLEQAKAHIRVDGNEDDTLIEGLITAAREYAETHTRRQLCTATYAMRMAYLPTCIEIPKPPLVSVSSITYADVDGNVQTLSSSLYTVDSYSYPGKIIPAYNASYPTVRGHLNDVVVTFVAGQAQAAVPVRAKQAMLLLIGHWYENREQAGIEVGAATFKIPFGVNELLDSLNWGSYR